MSVKKLFIARHGETDYNKQGLLQGRGIDAPLNETGWDQARKLAGYLQQYPTDHLVSSSLKRSWQTAEPFRDSTGLDIRKDEGLDEMDFGIYEGVPYTEAVGDLVALKEIWESGNIDEPVPGGESPLQVFERANGAVRKIMDQSSEETIVLILHGRLIRILLSEWLGYGLENMQQVSHQNGAVNHLVYNGEFEAVYLNKIEHLAV
ncbi:histidine phosphatase family protein [Rhodohalobacter halophilus]|uniref:histidine phosphatase family protein n=1 Tax=Rhodohalobacter halophilus TaxID=1812810 RepID=UPI00083FC35C|nr:histidine phosphatase family protein [Rhodohalobacter halophilus]